jgi:hypothetical protein
MDPYLERPGIWQQVHADLIVDIRRFLTPLVRPRYYVAIEQRTYLTILPPPDHRVEVPDVMVVTSQDAPALTATRTVSVSSRSVQPIVAELPQPEEVHHRYLEIRDTETHAVITTLEILSPANKVGREGRRQYEDKRLKVLGSMTNLVEIDLLRAGEPLPMYVSQHDDYRMIVSRHHQRPCADVYLFSVRQPIPDIPIPLQPGEAEPVLSVNVLLHSLYDQGSYDLMIDYQQPPVPPLDESDRTWAEGLLSAR